jgi:hypothetical protein
MDRLGQFSGEPEHPPMHGDLGRVRVDLIGVDHVHEERLVHGSAGHIGIANRQHVERVQREPSSSIEHVRLSVWRFKQRQVSGDAQLAVDHAGGSVIQLDVRPGAPDAKLGEKRRSHAGISTSGLGRVERRERLLELFHVEKEVTECALDQSQLGPVIRFVRLLLDHDGEQLLSIPVAGNGTGQVADGACLVSGSSKLLHLFSTASGCRPPPQRPIPSPRSSPARLRGLT